MDKFLLKLSLSHCGLNGKFAIDSDGALQELVGPRRRGCRLSFLDDTVLGMLHDSVTGGHMGYRRTLACARMRFFKQAEGTIQLWCKQAPNVLRNGSTTGLLEEACDREAFGRIGISGPCMLHKISILVISDYFTKWVEAIL